MPRRDVILALLVVVLWGVNFVAIDVGLRHVPPLLFLAIRFVFVAVPAIFFVPRPRVAWTRLLAIGATMSLGQFALLYLALHLGMPAGLASLVLQAQVVFSIVIAAVWLHERPSGRQLAGIGLAIAALAVIVTARWSGAAWLPAIVTIGAALSWAIGNVLTRVSRVASGLSIVVWTAPVVPLPALALSLAIDGPDQVWHAITSFSLSALLSTAYTVVGASLVGYGIWNGLLARNPAAKVTPFALLIPIVGFLAAWLAFGEAPTPVDLLAGAAMLVGLGLATLTRSSTPQLARVQ